MYIVVKAPPQSGLRTLPPAPTFLDVPTSCLLTPPAAPASAGPSVPCLSPLPEFHVQQVTVRAASYLAGFAQHKASVFVISYGRVAFHCADGSVFLSPLVDI